MKIGQLLLDTATFLVIEACLVLHGDRAVAEYVHQLDSTNHSLIDFFRSYTDFGKSFWYLWPCGIGAVMLALLLRVRNFAPRWHEKFAIAGRALLFLFLTISVSGLITDAIKPLIGRARPVELYRDNAYGFAPLTFHSAWNSMPSGHSTTAFALAFSLIILLPRLRALWLAIGFALILSRVMVNAHYVSDTLAGAAIAYITISGISKLLAQNGIVHLLQGIFPIDRKNPTR